MERRDRGEERENGAIANERLARICKRVEGIEFQIHVYRYIHVI